MFQVEAAAHANFLRSESAWFIVGIAREPVGLEIWGRPGDRVGDEIWTHHIRVYPVL